LSNRNVVKLLALSNRPLAKVEITPLNPPLSRGEKLQILPPSLEVGEGWGGVIHGFLQEVLLKAAKQVLLDRKTKS